MDLFTATAKWNSQHH